MTYFLCLPLFDCCIYPQQCGAWIQLDVVFSPHLFFLALSVKQRKQWKALINWNPGLFINRRLLLCVGSLDFAVIPEYKNMSMYFSLHQPKPEVFNYALHMIGWSRQAYKQENKLVHAHHRQNVFEQILLLHKWHVICLLVFWKEILFCSNERFKRHLQGYPVP